MSVHMFCSYLNYDAKNKARKEAVVLTGSERAQFTGGISTIFTSWSAAAKGTESS